MPEQANTTALVVADGDYKMSVKDFDAAGKKTELEFSIPTQQNFAQWSIQQQIGMLKQGQWASCNIPTIIWGLAYAFQIGADPIKGEIFPTGNGRWGTSNKFKIRKAIETGNIVGIQVDMKDTGEKLTVEGCVAKTDLECTVTISVRGWTAPIVRKARLSRWYKKNNPNWQGNPEHMLELNTVAHACEYVPGVTPVTGDDEAPTDTTPDRAGVIG